MSYSIGLHFKHIKDESEILDLIYNIQQEYNDEKNIQELLENCRWHLLNKYCYRPIKNFSFSSLSYKDCIENIFSNLFTYRIYYWKKYNLVALCYNSCQLPNHLKKYFEGYINFQNSCEQNYDYSEWKVLGDLAKPFIEKAKQLSLKDLYVAINDYEPSEDEDLEKYREYNEKQFVYNCVEKALDIKNALYLGETDAFKYFDFTNIFNYLSRSTIEIQISNFLKELCKES